jgi:carbon-monoxide dehydrogenase small subunit
MTTPIDIELHINGVHRRGSVEARRTLADFLREDCALTGTHLGCQHGLCGTCTVLFGDEPVRCCLMLAVQARGHQSARSRVSPPTVSSTQSNNH